MGKIRFIDAGRFYGLESGICSRVFVFASAEGTGHLESRNSSEIEFALLATQRRFASPIVRSYGESQVSPPTWTVCSLACANGETAVVVWSAAFVYRFAWGAQSLPQ